MRLLNQVDGRRAPRLKIADWSRLPDVDFDPSAVRGLLAEGGIAAVQVAVEHRCGGPDRLAPLAGDRPAPTSPVLMGDRPVGKR